MSQGLFLYCVSLFRFIFAFLNGVTGSGCHRVVKIHFYISIFLSNANQEKLNQK